MVSKKGSNRNHKNNKKPLGKKYTSSADMFSNIRLTKKNCIMSFVLATITSLSIAYILNIGPIDSESFSLKKNIEVVKELYIERLTCKYTFMSDYIKGPESLVYHEGRNSLFVSTRNGSIMELDVESLDTKKVYPIYKMITNKKEQCDGTYNTLPKCGRPLGIQFGVTSTTRNILYVADGIFGLYSLDINSEKITILNEGKRKMYTNDLIVTETGIYFTISSTTFDDHEYLYAIIEHKNNGMVMFYNFETKLTVQIGKNLYFPNGIQMMKNFIYVAETSGLRISKINLKNGERTNFINYLPGYPDNIRIVNKHGVNQLLVPIPEIISDSDEFFAMSPKLRNMIATIFSYTVLEKMIEKTSNVRSIFQYYDLESGELLRSINVPFNGLSISHVLEIEKINTIYFGSDNGQSVYACELS
uniref:Str_synth domain-containing protein n=1 Tax=Parastrongyloides trichosuri TaxID=131310 RepID=A0A0N5A762_PARTI